MQDYGIKVVPTVQWAEPETFEFCFDGIEKGCKQNNPLYFAKPLTKGRNCDIVLAQVVV